MADKGLVNLSINALPEPLRQPLSKAFEHTLDSYRLGGDAKATNFSWFRFESTTASVANTEFSIEHALNQTPSRVIPVLDLTLVNSRLVPLTVTRAPDARRVYLSSPTTSAAIVVYLEV